MLFFLNYLKIKFACFAIKFAMLKLAYSILYYFPSVYFQLEKQYALSKAHHGRKQGCTMITDSAFFIL